MYNGGNPEKTMTGGRPQYHDEMIKIRPSRNHMYDRAQAVLGNVTILCAASIIVAITARVIVSIF